jgi:hypothetical protein
MPANNLSSTVPRWVAAMVAALLLVLAAMPVDGVARTAPEPAHHAAKSKRKKKPRAACAKSRGHRSKRRVRCKRYPRRTRPKPTSRPTAPCCVASAPSGAPAAPCCAASAPSGEPTASNPTPSAVSLWDRPLLRDPLAVVADATHRDLRLDPDRDYVVSLGSGAATIPGGLTISGGHDVVLDGGHIAVPDAAGGLTLKGQTGVTWVHNLRISGPQLMEGIDLDQREPGATVVLRNVLVDTVHGSAATNHADLLQTWAGPARLLVDGFTGSTEYQGFFLLPNQHFTGPPPQFFDLRHVDIDDRGGYALWRATGSTWPLLLQDVHVRPNPAKPARDWWLWPKPSTGDASWSAVSGSAPTESFVRPGGAGAIGVSDVQRLVPRPEELVAPG